VALIAVYLAIASVIHLSPFPAKTTSAVSSTPPTQASSAGSSPGTGSSSASASATPTSPGQQLLAKIPATITASSQCSELTVSDGATAKVQCTESTGQTSGIVYYLYANTNALNQGFEAFLNDSKFNTINPHPKSCTATNGDFSSFTPQCRSVFTNTSPAVSGSIVEYQRKGDLVPIIASTDNQQLVLAVMVGRKNQDLLTYWQQFGWIKS
jgi:hypothetical protein